MKTTENNAYVVSVINAAEFQKTEKGTQHKYAPFCNCPSYQKVTT